MGDMDGRRTDSGDGHGGRQKNIPVSRACVELCIGVQGGKSGGGVRPDKWDPIIFSFYNI